ncbi:sugar-phosphatase [Ktedonospora formicarum]|uniref:Sugar-phosphatase n=1 Tax=Ktedonospora formicarum TaxID=2778364 RepID=A0A8J3I4V3_9CHLR|nr:HAD-IIB family hydrolase [Ktedonospora formicarum]GHO44829.1 sugar-phosphatase [Ktedonospora formicarum]
MHQPQPLEPLKMLAIDIDGTLLNPQKQITARTREAIQAARQAGLVVTLATARRHINTRGIASTLGVDIPIILYDGALILEHPNGHVFHTLMLQAEIAQQALDILVQHRVQPVIHHYYALEEETWTGLEEFDTPSVTNYLTSSQTLRRFPYASCCLGQPDPLRIVAFTSEEVVQAILPTISALNCAWNMTPLGSYHTAELSIMHARCSKASGVQTLADSLGIPMSQVMAIGMAITTLRC